MDKQVNFKDIRVGSYADYFDTGIWTLSREHGVMFAPDDLTVSQLKDFLLAGGGSVYLHKSGKLAWRT